jgi:protein-S-isoprenylcysteine O-methyltransferase Ste14
MNATTPVKQSNEKPDLTVAIVRRLIQVGVGALIQTAILFISAGRLNWAMAWAYLGVYLGIVAINALVILPKNPELIAERGQTKENIKGWDKLLTNLIAIPMLGTLIVAGLQTRYEWSPQLGLAIQIAALAVVALGYGLASWAMASNPFFSRTVRIQMDRGQTVASGGPYRYVRHPGYVGTIVTALTTPLALGSLWALILGGLSALLMVVRTVLEDKMLLDELDGYKEYARRVRYRLAPGIW